MGALTAYMRNTKVPEFSYDTLKVAYDTDPRLQQLIQNFDQHKVEFNGGSVDALMKTADPGKSKIKSMAMQAIDLKK